jgi:hypothetical protein
MALKLRPSRLGSGIDKERQDYTVYSGGWDIGRIYETRGGPEHLRWFWSFAVQGPMTRSDREGPVSCSLGSLESLGEAGRASLTAASILGTKYGEPGLTDALPDTSNLRVWDAWGPRWVSPFAGPLPPKGSPAEAGPRTSVPSQTPEEEMSGVRQRQHFT